MYTIEKFGQNNDYPAHPGLLRRKNHSEALKTELPSYIDEKILHLLKFAYVNCKTYKL